ncbi:MAG: prohead protease/major capsid protein fusion protein [Planctomycetota bacterium]
MPPTTLTERLAPAGLELRIAPDSFNEETREFEVVMSTGARVRRYSYARGAFDEVLSLDPRHIRLDRINSGRAPFVEEHRHLEIDKTIGSIVEGSVAIRDGKLIGRVRMHETPRAVEITERMRRGELTCVSLGYATYEQEVVESEEGPDTRTAVDWEPFELSLTPMPAETGAHTRSAEHETFEVVIRSRTETPMPEPNDESTPAPKAADTPADSKPTDPAPNQRSGAPSPDPAPSPSPAPAPQHDVDAERRGAEAERKRSAEIRKLTRNANLDDQVADDLIARAVPIDAAREEILEKWNQRHGGQPTQGQLRVGEEAATKHGSAIERVLLERFDGRSYALKDEDDARQLRGYTLLELGERHMAELGISLVGVGNKSERAERMLQARAGYHTTTDFPNVLGNVTGRVLTDGFNAAPRDFLQLVRERTAPDFREIRPVKLGPASQLKLVLEAGEYEYGTIGEGAEAYRILKYGEIVAITREAIVNDDLDAFARAPQKIGQQAALAENIVFWAILGENPLMADGLPLFHTDHGNVVTGALDQAGLTEARTAMRLQTDLDGRTRINVMPRFVMVPAELEIAAQRLLVLPTVPTETAQANPFTRALTPIGSPFLSDFSSIEWFMAASAREVDTFELAYLQGQREPYFEVRNGFERDGIEIKIRHEFGMKAIEHRGLVKSTG